MKKIPARYELDERDIKEAITLWINHWHESEDGGEYIINIHAETRGLSENFNETKTTSITAVATKE